MGDEREFKIKMSVDAASAITGTQQAAQGFEKTAESVGKAGDAQEKAGDQAKGHSGHLKAMHKIIHGLNEVVPGLGILMQAAFSPVGAAISAAMIVLRLFNEKMKETNDEFKRMEDEAAKPATNRMAAWREATVQAAVGLNRLNQSLVDAARAERTLKDSTEQTTATFKQQIQAAGTLAEAVRDNELARLDTSHAAGLASDAEYAMKRLEIEQRYLDKKRELEERDAMTEILIKKRAIEQAEMDQPKLTTAAQLAELKKTSALESLGSLDKAGVEERKKSFAAALAELEKKTEPDLLRQFHQIGPEATTAEADRWMRSNATKESPYYTMGSDYFEIWSKLKLQSQGADREWRKFPKDEARRKVEADRASAESERASKAAVDNQSFITTTGREIGDSRNRFDRKHESNIELGQLQQDTALRQALAAAQKKQASDSQEMADALNSFSGVSASTIKVAEDTKKLVHDLEARVQAMEGRAPRTSY